MKKIIQTCGSPKLVSYLMPRLPDAQLCYARKDKTAAQTYIEALRMVGDGPSLHLEDDIHLTIDFERKVREVIDKVGEGEVIQFFSMRKDDSTLGSRWDRNYMMNQCHYFPKGLASAIADFGDKWVVENPEHGGGCDMIVRDFLKVNKMRYWIQVPSLVQHLSLPSRISPRSTKRQSKTFVDPWL